MSETDDDVTRFARYLTGDLAEAERDRLEVRFFTDDGYFEELVAAEDDLANGYALERLEPALRQRLAETWLRSASAQRAVRLASGLAETLREARARRELSGRPWPGWRHLVSGVALRWRAATLPLAAAALLGAVWLGFENARLGRQLRAVEAEQAELRRRGEEMASRAADYQHAIERLEESLARERARPEAGPKPAAPPLVSFVLAAGGLTRSSAAPPTLLVGPTFGVRLRLHLPPEARATVLRAVLQRAEGEVVWSEDTSLTARAPEGRALVLELPPGVLRGGDFVLELLAPAPSGDLTGVASYAFRVTTRPHSEMPRGSPPT